jgi:hypothetical protein
MAPQKQSPARYHESVLLALVLGHGWEGLLLQLLGAMFEPDTYRGPSK